MARLELLLGKKARGVNLFLTFILFLVVGTQGSVAASRSNTTYNRPAGRPLRHSVHVPLISSEEERRALFYREQLTTRNFILLKDGREKEILLGGDDTETIRASRIVGGRYIRSSIIFNAQLFLSYLMDLLGGILFAAMSQIRVCTLGCCTCSATVGAVLAFHAEV